MDLYHNEGKEMNIREIVSEWLKEHGYDGLYSQDECACALSDLMPCGEVFPEDCEPGYKVDCPRGHEYNFMITENKEEECP